jgi:GcrA cell cycle regulator
MDWTNEAIDQLRGLWAEGHSTAEIGRRMGISKNAVVGKAHRLSLPPRPSPIRREPGAVRPVQPRRAIPAAPRPPIMPMRRLTGSLPPMPRSAVQHAPVPAQPATPVAAAPAPRPQPAPQPAPVPVAASAVVRPFPRASQRTCCWPMGEPGTAEFRFCGGEAIPTKPYCADHAAIAYVKVRDRREDAA